MIQRSSADEGDDRGEGSGVNHQEISIRTEKRDEGKEGERGEGEGLSQSWKEAEETDTSDEEVSACFWSDSCVYLQQPF